MKSSQKILTLLLISLLELPVVLGISHASSNNVITINPDGSISPMTAPITRNGDAYTLTSNINEPIEIHRNNTVFDGENHNIQGNLTSQGILLANTKNVTVRNTKISGFLAGIKLSFSTDNTVSDNSVTNCTYGILADKAPNTKITNNTIQSNKWDGIFITASAKSTITNNTVENNGKWGIYLGYSADSTLRNNKMKNNRYNFGVSVDYNHDIDTSNTINNKPIYYWINQQNTQVPNDAAYVALINSNNINLRNLNLSQNGQGVLLVNSENNIIENSNIKSNGYFGIQLIDSHSNTMQNNTIADNDWGGIALISSTDNILINNTIKNNQKGIYLANSNSNTIYLNNFINNTQQAWSQESTNTWDSGLTSRGNYWSDYKGADADGDGIGDTAYIIDDQNQDNYPSMHVVQEVPSNYNPMNPILLAGGIATIIIAAMLAYLIKKRKSALKDANRLRLV